MKRLVEKGGEILEVYKGDSNYEVAKFDISTFIDDSDRKLRGSFNYATEIYEEGTIRRYIETYKNILREYVEKIGVSREWKIRDIGYVRGEEYERVVREWNRSEKEYGREGVIHKIFEGQVEEVSDRVAVVYEDRQITYGELNRRSNQLAHYLIRKYGVSGDRMVVLCLDRSEEMIIGILGVLKAGGGYVPIDPSYPEERIKYILEDTKANVIISNERYGKRLEDIEEI